MLDDEAALRGATSRLSRLDGDQVIADDSGEAILASVTQRPPGCALLEANRPGPSGLQVPREPSRIDALPTAFALGGIAWYGVAHETLGRVRQNLADRPGGPMVLRYVLQPTMATIPAVLAGLRDARQERAPFTEATPTRPSERARREVIGA